MYRKALCSLLHWQLVSATSTYRRQALNPRMLHFHLQPTLVTNSPT